MIKGAGIKLPPTIGAGVDMPGFNLEKIEEENNVFLHKA